MVYGVPQQTEHSGNSFCSLLEIYVLSYLKTDQIGSVAHWFSFLSLHVHVEAREHLGVFPPVLSTTIFFSSFLRQGLSLI